MLHTCNIGDWIPCLKFWLKNASLELIQNLIVEIGMLLGKEKAINTGHRLGPCLYLQDKDMSGIKIQWFHWIQWYHWINLHSDNHELSIHAKTVHFYHIRHGIWLCISMWNERRWMYTTSGRLVSGVIHEPRSVTSYVQAILDIILGHKRARFRDYTGRVTTTCD